MVTPQSHDNRVQEHNPDLCRRRRSLSYLTGRFPSVRGEGVQTKRKTSRNTPRSSGTCTRYSTASFHLAPTHVSPPCWSPPTAGASSPTYFSSSSGSSPGIKRTTPDRLYRRVPCRHRCVLWPPLVHRNAVAPMAAVAVTTM